MNKNWLTIDGPKATVVSEVGVQPWGTPTLYSNEQKTEGWGKLET